MWCLWCHYPGLLLSRVVLCKFRLHFPQSVNLRFAQNSLSAPYSSSYARSIGKIPGIPLTSLVCVCLSLGVSGSLVSCYGITDCSSGSMQASWHTSVTRSAIGSRVSLYLIEGKPPFAHERACLMIISFPHLHCREVWVGASCSAVPWHCGMQPYAG